MTNLAKRVVRTHPIRYLGYPIKDYAIEISAAGVRFRRKGTRQWFECVSWELLLEKSVQITARENRRQAATQERGRKRA